MNRVTILQRLQGKHCDPFVLIGDVGGRLRAGLFIGYPASARRATAPLTRCIARCCMPPASRATTSI